MQQIYIKELNTDREQYMVHIILYREHKMKTIINIIITVHIYLCSAVQYELMQTECQSPVSVSYRVQCIRGWWGVCGVTGMSSVQSDCLWKNLSCGLLVKVL